METNFQIPHWRTQLLSLISHEIRTPLTTIIAFAQTLQSEDEDITNDERKYYLSIIEKESKRISQFLGELIDISHFESNSEYLNFSKFDYIQLIKLAIDEFKEKNTIDIELKTSEKTLPVYIDTKRMLNAFYVLFSYMLRNYNGPIEITINLRSSIILTTFNRTTISISEKDLHELFDLNRQLLLTKTSKSIKTEPVYAATIIRAHQGQIWVSSSPGTGLRISFELPLFTGCGI